MLIISKLIFVFFISEIDCRRLKNPETVQLNRRRILVHHQNRRVNQICYDIVGCFDLPHKLSPLMKGPESPSLLNTKFFLFRHDLNPSSPQRLYYEDNGVSLNHSKFDVRERVKVIVHGYMGNWRNDDSLNGALLYTQICKCNVILLDWEKGAQGPHYANAAANTEIVGRQLGTLLLHMINNGLNPRQIHVVGFSLGAHVAGCASELLKNNGFMIGRITGLDAASPLFRHNHIRDKSKKLDKGDALLVDVIHTDSSPFFTDGFGLLEPIGHVDFFPNGGFEQPGCYDKKASVVVSHLEHTVTRETACSHVRAWELFRESLEIKLNRAPKCSFTAYKCSGGLEEYMRGGCFPSPVESKKASLDSSYRNDIGNMGDEVQGEGIMYLATKNKYPFCGVQMQIVIFFDQNSDGVVHCNFHQGNGSVKFKMPITTSQTVLYGLSVMDTVTVSHDSDIKGSITYYQPLNEKENSTEVVRKSFLLHKVTLRDIAGHSWSMCIGGSNLKIQDGPSTITLKSGSC